METARATSTSRSARALARTELGQLEIVVVVGTIVHESAFYDHPHVRRLPVAEERLDLVGTPESE